MTYSQLLDEMYASGMNCADVALGRMMDEVADDNGGTYPGWDDKVAGWVIDIIYGGKK